MTDHPETLKDLRHKLDGIDHRLLELIAERQATIREIVRAKRSTGFPLRDYQREREVFQGARAKAEAVGVSPQVAESMMRLLIRYSLTLQERNAVTDGRHGGGRRALVIGGAGKMGGWFAQFLYTQGFEVEIADPRAPAAANGKADWRDTDLKQDYIVVAAPLNATNEVLHELAARRPPGVVFDVGSLKSPLRSGLAALSAAGVQVASLHPMFGPDAELLSGRHVIFIDLGAEALEKARALFAPTMAEQVVMTLEEHDRLIAYVLGLSHAVNIAFFTVLAESGEAAPKLAQLSSTTFDAQLDVARRVAQENPDLYYEIQSLNDYGGESLAALSQAVQRLRGAVGARDRDTFVALMRAGRDYLTERRREADRRR